MYIDQDDRDYNTISDNIFTEDLIEKIKSGDIELEQLYDDINNCFGNVKIKTIAYRGE